MYIQLKRFILFIFIIIHGISMKIYMTFEFRNFEVPQGRSVSRIPSQISYYHH